MKKNYYFYFLLSCTTALTAQNKDDLSDVPNLLETIKYINIEENGKDVYINNKINPIGDFTVEIESKLTSVNDRGWDMEAVDDSGKGFRISVNKNAILNSANLLEKQKTLIEDVNDEYVTYRYVVKDELMNIYKNNGSEAIIKDIPKTKINKNLIERNSGFETGTVGADALNWTKSGSGGSFQTVEAATFDGQTDAVTAASGNLFTHFSCTWAGTSIGTLTYKHNVSVVDNKVYKLRWKYHRYVTAENSNVKNVKVSVYNGSNEISISRIFNGHGQSGWVTDSTTFMVPSGCNNVDVTIQNTANNKVQIYFDDFEIETIGELAPDLTMSNEHNVDNKAGIYCESNILSDLDPGFEITEPENFPTYWVTNKSIGSNTDSRVINYSNITTKEGDNSFMIKLTSDSYYSMKIPAGRLSENTTYILKFDYCIHSATAFASNVWPKFNVSVNSLEDGKGVNLLAKTAFNTADRTGQFIGKTDFGVTFTTPSSFDPDIDYYIVFTLNGTTPYNFQIDKMTLRNQISSFDSVNSLVVGKNVNEGAANMEFKSIKYTDGAYIPNNVETDMVETYNDGYLSYDGNVLEITGLESDVVYLYNINGKLISELPVYDNKISYRIKLDQGVYLIKSNNKCYKMIVKK